MNADEKNFLSLIEYTVKNRFGAAEAAFPVLEEPVCFKGILAAAGRHNLFPLAFEVLSRREDFASSAEYGACAETAMRLIAAQAQRTQAFLDLYRAFNAEGVRPLVMKGIICRELYGDFCDHRPSCDEDLLIQKKNYEKAVAVLKKQGYKPRWDEITEKQKDAVQEVSFYGDILHVELHLNPMSYDNELCAKMNGYFENVFDNVEEEEIDGVNVCVMNPTDHFLFLVLHGFKHFTVGGLGIRQAVDILLFEEKYYSRINRSRVLKALEELRAAAFFSDLVNIGNEYLGFNLPAVKPPRCAEDLLEDIMSSGTFGNDTQARRTAQRMTSAAMNGRGRRTLLRTLFPDRAGLISHDHPELAEKPWLLPIFWVKRWGRFLKHNRENGGNLAAESMEIGNRRIELMKRYDILP